MREYGRQVLKSWWSLVGIAGGLLGIINGVSGLAIPSLVWVTLLIGGLVLAQVQAYLNAVEGPRRQQTQLEPVSVSAPAIEGAEPTPTEPTPPAVSSASVQPALDRNILRGRIYPYVYAPSVESAETALAMRAALAARIPRQPEPALDSDDERAFEDVVANSFFEAWLLDETSRIGRAAPDHWWRSVEPTRSTIVSLRRPPAPMIVDGWTLEGRASLSLRPHPSIDPPGWSILTLDAVIRPDGEEARSRPLALEEFYELLYTLLSALLDEIAPSVLPRITGSDSYELLAVAVVATASGRQLSEFVPLERSNWRRAEGAYDPIGGEWEPDSYVGIATTEARAETVRGWIRKLLRDAGIRSHENDIDAMAAPTLRKPPPT